MNSTFESGTSAPGARSHTRLSPRAIVAPFAALTFAVALGAGLVGCSILKPTEPTARYFVLKPLPATGPGPAVSNSLAVGLGQVKLPSYLFNTSLAVSKGTNEIEYLPSAFWAERLDTGFQRVLAADLATVLPAEQVRLSSWQSEDVAAEVQLTVEQFDVDAKGQGVLIAQWRILSPGGEKILKIGSSRLSHQGPPPNTNASGAVATLSELVADLSRQLAQALKETPLASRNGPSQP
jgi:uncharacterized lipoprotein YmbA